MLSGATLYLRCQNPVKTNGTSTFIGTTAYESRLAEAKRDRGNLLPLAEPIRRSKIRGCKKPRTQRSRTDNSKKLLAEAELEKAALRETAEGDPLCPGSLVHAIKLF